MEALFAITGSLFDFSGRCEKEELLHFSADLRHAYNSVNLYITDKIERSRARRAFSVWPGRQETYLRGDIITADYKAEMLTNILH